MTVLSSCTEDLWAHKAKSVHHLALYRPKKKKSRFLVYKRREEKMGSEAGRPASSLPRASSEAGEDRQIQETSEE